MTFRARLVLVATGAVLVVVLLGAVATYVVAYDSLVGSVDTTLEQNARNLIAGNASRRPAHDREHLRAGHRLLLADGVGRRPGPSR